MCKRNGQFKDTRTHPNTRAGGMAQRAHRYRRSLILETHSESRRTVHDFTSRVLTTGEHLTAVKLKLQRPTHSTFVMVYPTSGKKWLPFSIG